MSKSKAKIDNGQLNIFDFLRQAVLRACAPHFAVSTCAAAR